MRFNVIPPLICYYSLLQLHTAFSLPSIPLNNPSLSLISNPASLNLTLPTSHLFPIPDTDLIIDFDSFGPLLDISELGELLNQAQRGIQAQINRQSPDAFAPHNTYFPWHTDHVVLDFWSVTPVHRITLGQLRSLVAGLRLYMIKGRRSREAKFRLIKQGEVFLTVLAGGDIWLIK